MKYLFSVALLFLASIASADYQILVDHDCLDISAIPASYITAAKDLTIHYAHTSHGQHMTVQGGLWLEGQDSTYGMAINVSGTAGLPAQEDPKVIRLYEGCPPKAFGVGGGCYYNDCLFNAVGALDSTRGVLDTGDYDVFMFAWCSNLEWWSNSTNIDNYTDAMSTLESEYPAVTVVYMTQHLAASSDASYTYTDSERQNCYDRNNDIRDYCFDNNKVLFDFADIEAYNDGVGPCLTNDLHSNYNNLPVECDWDDAEGPGTCSHADSENCAEKARAFWWLVARIAGWDGTTGMGAIGITLTGGSLQ